jgi:hypothetical protein
MSLRYVFDREQSQVMNVLIGMVSHPSKYSQIGITRMVNETRRSRHEFAVDFQGRALESWIQ